MSGVGGFRPGVGRPKGSKTRKNMITDQDRKMLAQVGLTPLEYMLKVMNDGEADPNRRDRMAVAAAPYCHGRIADRQIGKKEQQAEAAKAAGQGTEWAADLAFGEAH